MLPWWFWLHALLCHVILFHSKNVFPFQLWQIVWIITSSQCINILKYFKVFFCFFFLQMRRFFYYITFIWQYFMIGLTQIYSSVYLYHFFFLLFLLFCVNSCMYLESRCLRFLTITDGLFITLHKVDNPCSRSPYI